MLKFAWLIPVFPLLGFILISVGKSIFRHSSAGVVGSLTVFLSFLLSAGIFFEMGESPLTIKLFDWINSGTLTIPFSFLIDPVSAVMLLIITGVGFLIHVYSVGYMKGDEGFSRFFAYLNLFIFFMLLLVMGDNFIVMFAGWEGVGLCSYLLIGFWFKNNEYNLAANKAFIMNRIGDLGFLLGIILIYITFGSTSYDVVFSKAENFSGDPAILVAITVLLFIGAMGKSAQIPLYTWLPDAMAGPTPVSALIHAATMVTAGVYMVVRSNILFTLAPDTLVFIAITGSATALLAAIIALAQLDIKKVLAYSTVSQLGFMFVALGAGAYTTALFHVTTHAFFKALLFLAAGSVIHAMSGEQDISRMGGLRRKLPVTHAVFLIGTLAISGLPPLAGFFSKDEILVKVWMQYKPLFIVLAITSLLTAFYMFRLYFLTFFGSFRGSADQNSHLHESPAVMTMPLIVLALLSAAGGFLGLPHITGAPHLFDNFLHGLVSFPASFNGAIPDHSFEYALMGGSFALLLMLIYFAHRRYAIKQCIIPAESTKPSAVSRFAYSKFYVDELYDAIIVRPLNAISGMLYKVIDTTLIDGIVNSTGRIITAASDKARRMQTGLVGFYIFAMVAGIIAIMFFNLIA